MEAVRVRLKVTLRAGPVQYAVGSVFTAPFPAVIAGEMEAETGTVEVLETKVPDPLAESSPEKTSDLNKIDKKPYIKRQRKKQKE